MNLQNHGRTGVSVIIHVIFRLMLKP